MHPTKMMLMGAMDLHPLCMRKTMEDLSIQEEHLIYRNPMRQCVVNLLCLGLGLPDKGAKNTSSIKSFICGKVTPTPIIWILPC